LTTLTYPGGLPLRRSYDALGRMTNQADWAGRQMKFAYDKADQLISRTYPNGIVQSNAFDSAGRLLNLQYGVSSSSPSIALQYAYDRNGNKKSWTEKGTLNWPIPANIDETAAHTPGGRLITRTDVAGTNRNWTYAYDPSGNMTNATGPGQSFALSYDEDNRVLSVGWNAGVASKSIQNRYDAFGRRVQRTVDGATTSYVLDLFGDMERILCDLNPDATLTYYVHGPDLCYAVDAAGNVVNYHADAMGNIIALTDATASNVAQYAYTPYGCVLGSSFAGTCSLVTDNPYLFVGSQGVMQELPGLYFMRARYYSADTGSFLSTDPVKTIGPGWPPAVYRYPYGNPLRFTDPRGEYAAEQLFDDVIHLSSSIGKAFVKDIIKYSTKGVMWAVKNGYVASEEMIGAIQGRIEGGMGGWAGMGMVKEGVAGFVVDKALDAIEGKGKSVPILGDIPFVGPILFRYHEAGGDLPPGYIMGPSGMTRISDGTQSPVGPSKTVGAGNYGSAVNQQVAPVAKPAPLVPSTAQSGGASPTMQTVKAAVSTSGQAVNQAVQSNSGPGSQSYNNALQAIQNAINVLSAYVTSLSRR
jgi:RHS repeat-associated protein